ncbi:CC138 protein, partial [Asarcornis scutulata]|nr:CC138 protein [Asarcornis scutulata]
QLLPMVIGQLQRMPFVDPKLHMSVIEFIYWSLRQIDTSSQDASMTSTMERLAEVILKGAVQRGSMQNWNGKPTQSKPKLAHFFKSKSMPLRFLSTLVVLRTAKRMNYLSHAFRSLCVDLKTDEGKILFLQYRCVPIILSHLTISKKCLLFVALNALVEMAMNNDKIYLKIFLEDCSNEHFFRTFSALLQNRELDISILERICFILRKLSEITSNKNMFELFALRQMIEELLGIKHPEQFRISIDAKAILHNLGVAKSNAASRST